MDPPPPHFLYPAQIPFYSHPPPPSAVAASQPSAAPEFCTPMSPYRSQNPTPYSLPQPSIPSATLPYPSYAANSAVFHPHSSSPNVFFRQDAWYPVPRSHAIINNNSPPIPHPNRNSSSNDNYIRRLRNEVIFLHALWDQGPPNSGSNSNSVADPGANLHHYHHLKPCSTTAFKKKKNTRPTPVSDKPWPVPPDHSNPSDFESGWPEFPPRSTPPVPVASEEDTARVLAAKVQRKALDSFRSFFGGKHDPECESESDDDVQDQDEVCAKFDKFWEVFEGDQELRDYYVKNWGNGEFLCFVCDGSGQKVGRKYKNCLALVQHTVTVSNTKKKNAHRAYGQVLCKVLGWDINQLPLVSRNLSLQQGNCMSSAEACKDDPVVVETTIAPLISENEESDPSKATSDLGEDISANKKESSELSLIVYNPGDQPINITSSAGSSENHLDIAEENTDEILNEHGPSDPPNAGTDTGDENAAEKETPSLPCAVMGSQGGNTDTYVSVRGSAAQI